MKRRTWTCFAVVPAVAIVCCCAPSARADAPLTLADAVRLALAKNERAKIADYQVDVASAAVDRARTAFFPTLVTTGNDQLKPDAVTRPGVTPPPNDVATWSTTLSQPILNASAWPLYRQAERLFDAQKATSEDAKLVLEYDAANAYFAALSQEENLAAAQHRLDSAKANLDDTKARVEAQLSSSNDATRAAVDLASAQQQVDTTKGTVNRAYLALSFVLDEPVQGPLAPPTATLQAAQIPLTKVESLVAIGESRRLDLIAAKHSARAAELFASEPMLRLIPTLGVAANLTGTTNSAASGRWNDESLTATATWTVFDAGVRYADKHSREAQFSIATLQADTLIRSIANDVRTAAALLSASQAALLSAEQAVTAAKQSLEETTILYRQGLAKAIELVDANDSRFLAETGYATAEFSVAEAYLALREAMGLEPLGTVLQ